MRPATHLTVEHLGPGQPCGSPRPRGSWWLPAGSAVQHAYALRVGRGDAPVWESGRREGDGSTLVDLDLPADARGRPGWWQVRVWTDVGAADWSAPAPLWLAAIPDVLRTATWIEPDEPTVPPPGERPAHQLRHEFTLPGAPVAATAWATAHGIYELFVNGARAGDLELTPGFTAYRARLQVQPLDVTGLLHAGDNAVELLLSDGWFRGRHGFVRAADGFGNRVAALLAIDIRSADGTTTTVTTGPGWWSRPSRVTAADLMDGQRTDLRMPAPGRLGLDTPGWRPVHPMTEGNDPGQDHLVLSVAPPVRRVQQLDPVSVRRYPDGSTVVDFGQNINGWVRLRDLGPTGTELTLTHGEHLDDTGLLSTDHLKAFDFATGHPLPAGQVDSVVSAGTGEGFEPRHTTHGFRYVRIDGHPGLAAADVTGVVVHSELAPAGRFRCSDDRLTALHDAAVWSFRGNACDIPTDCPQRERSGFSGDWQVYVATAALTHDVAGFSDKWLRDLAADQWPDGRIPTISPNPAGAGPSGNSFQDAMEGSAGWGDAAVLVPWELWRAYGDLAVLERQYESMTRWVGYAAGMARARRHPDRAAARPEPAPHERYLWDTGGHFGEWLEPGEVPAPDPAKDHGIVATAYLARSAALLARVAALIGRATEAGHHDRLARNVAQAWQREYLDGHGAISSGSQADHVRALAFDLVPDDLRDAVADRLAALVAGNDHHLGTGFLSTGMLLPTLADSGHLDEAYRVLLSTGFPSWLEMIDQGATTIWERWDGVRDGRATGSLNHYSKGAVVSFLHTHVAGIRLPDSPGLDAAGYRRFIVEPRSGGGLSWAEAEHASPYGPVRSAWHCAGHRLSLTVDVPPGTRAEIRLPDGRVVDAEPGRHTLAADLATRRLSRSSPRG